MQRPILFKIFLLLATLALSSTLVPAVWSQTAVGFNTPPPSGAYTLEGCRNDGTLIFPSTNNAEGGGFVCPDSAYTTGNLQKNWNELDLVPFRLITHTQPGSITDYNIIIAGEYSRTGEIGWDVIGSDAGTGPTRNPNSDASCSATWNGFFTNGPGIGGSDSSIYRTLSIHQAAGSTCIWDYYMRLSLDAALYSGSNLHGFMFQSADFSQGKKDVPIPVNEIKPQSIQKDMTATQPSQVVWNITKTPVPANLTFGSVCDTSTPLSRSVTLKVDWTASAPQPNGAITITTHVYATNPDARAITITVTDKIYVGTTATGTPLDVATSAPTVIPANTASFLVLTHTTTDSVQTHTDFNDVATGAYTDTVTNDPIPETTTATASAHVVSSSPINTTATIEDTETISPFPTFSFSLDSFTGSGGYAGGAVSSPSGYTLGTQVTSVPLVWDSNSVSASGEVVFNKTVDFNGTGAGTFNGTLSDSAVVQNGSTILAGPTAASVTGVSSAPAVKLTINKTITPAPLPVGSSPVVFTFHIKDGTNTEISGSPFTLTFNPGDSSQSTGSITLAPSVYTITEDAVSGWITDTTTHTVDLSASSSAKCTGTTSFANTQKARIKVVKQTHPSGSPQSFSFTPSYEAGFNLTDGQSNLSDFLAPGSGYSVSESLPTGWTQTSATCDNGDSPSAITLAAGQLVTCTFVNTQKAQIKVVKQTNPSGSSQSFNFSPNYESGFSLTDGQFDLSGFLSPTSGYSVSETVPTGWVQTSATCDNGNSPSAITLAPGALVTCTFLNTQQAKAKVIKTLNGGAIPLGTSFTFQLRSGASASAAGTILETGIASSANGGIINFSTLLVPGQTYQMCEQIMPGWLTTLGPPLYSVFNPSGDNSVVCTNFTPTAGQTVTFSINNLPPPGGLALTIGFWKNWASCANSNGKQKPVLDQTLASFSGGGVLIGNLFVDTCPEAVDILNKTTLSGKKEASNPFYNLAAQLLAADLNVQAGAGVTVCANTDITSAQNLLVAVGFNGVSVPKGTPTQQTIANNLQTQLNNYNNNLPAACIVFP